MAQEPFSLRHTCKALLVHCDWFRLLSVMGGCVSCPQVVKKYDGFTEHAYRLVFPYEEKFPDKEPALLTILPSGVIETTKILRPDPERALMSYTFNQFITQDAMADKKVEFADTQWDGKRYTETPFVKDMPTGNLHTLVQTWPTKLNVEFKNSFKVQDTNPNPDKFSAAAVADFKTCVQALFGEDATKTMPIKYCHKQTNNNNPCYLGMTEELLMYLSNNKKAMEEVGIKEVTKEGFVATGTDGKGNNIEKPFTMEPKKEYVVYKKAGWETMGCCKLKEQFDKECDLLGKGVVTH